MSSTSQDFCTTSEFIPRLVLVHEEAWQDQSTQEILKRLERYTPEIATVANDQEAKSFLSRRATKHIYLCRNPHRFVRPKEFGKDCSSGVPRAYCLDHISGCHFACVYCYLHSYLEHDPLVRIYTNLADLQEQLEELCSHITEPIWISTGELSDSLLFDWITEFSTWCSNFLAHHPLLHMEFRSKSAYCGFVKRVKSLPNLCFTWTVSPPAVVQRYELKTASLPQRIAALQTCQNHNLTTGLIIDPMIHTPQWRQDYQGLIESLAQSIDLQAVQRLFVGSFRYMKGMDRAILKKFPKTDLFLDEFALARDSKYRYYKPIRKEMYAYVKALLDQHCVAMDLSMEFPETWLQLTGKDVPLPSQC